MPAWLRGADRVEETANQQSLSAAEPAMQKFEEPVGGGEGIAMQSPGVPFESAFLDRPQMPGVEPVGPLSLYDPFIGGSFIPLSPPPLPTGLCAPVKTKGTAGDRSGACGQKKSAGSFVVGRGSPALPPTP